MEGGGESKFASEEICVDLANQSPQDMGSDKLKTSQILL